MTTTKSSNSKLPPCPKGLTAESRRLWTSTVEQFELEEHHLMLLRRACEQLDTVLKAQAIVAKEGIVALDRFGQKKVHPATEVARASALALKQLVREMGLDVQIPESRGPRRPGTRG